MKAGKNIVDEWIARVKEWMGRPGASPSFIAQCQRQLERLEKDRTTAFRWGATTKKDWEEKRRPKINPRPDIP